MTTTALHGGTTPLAALTTIFTPPCPTSWLLTGSRAPSQLPMFPRRGPESCNPPAWSRNLDGGGFQYYSPAICPSGFAVGPGCGLQKTRTDEGFPSLRPGEMVAYCVPSGMICTTDLTDFRGGVWGWTQAVTAPGAAITVGPAIQIRWVESDLEILETHPLTPGLRRQAVATNNQVPLPVPSSGSLPSSGDGPLVTGEPEIQSSPIPTTPTTTDGQRASSSSSSAPVTNGGWPLDRNATVFLIIVLVILISVIIGIMSLITIRRHKFGKLTGTPARIMEWLIPLQHKRDPLGNGKMVEDDEIAGANLSNLSNPLPPELEYGPARGSTENPAELDGWGISQKPKRWSGVPQRPKRPRTLSFLAGDASLAAHRLTTVKESSQEGSERGGDDGDYRPPVPPKAPPIPPKSPGRSLTAFKRLSGSKSPTRDASVASPPIPSPLSPADVSTARDSRWGTETKIWSYWKPPENPNTWGVF